jgi:hypothetical protein
MVKLATLPARHGLIRSTNGVTLASRRSTSIGDFFVRTLMLNIRFQLDTPQGLLDIHAFVTNQEDGNFLVYCRKGNEQTSRVVSTFSLAMACVTEIMDRIEKEVLHCSSQLSLSIA